MHLTVQIEGINLEKLLRSAQEAGIVLRAVQRSGERAMRVCVSPGDGAALSALCEKSGWQMREIRAGFGLRAVRFLKRRAMLPAAALLCVLLVYISSQMILRIKVEHARENVAEVHRFLSGAGVRLGRLKAAFSLDDLRVRLAYAMPGLAFASLRYEGSTLVVDCRPAQLGEQLAIPGNAFDIVAAKPGIVTRISASSGTPVVAPGQAVRKGQVLIKGEERTEKGGTRAVKAEGQVSARVFARGEAKVSLTQTRTVETGQERTRVTIKSPWHTRVTKEAEPFDSCVKSREDQAVVGLYLPLWREKTTYAETEVFKEPRSRADAASMAQGAAEEIAKKDCPHDALILDKWVDYSMIDNEFLYAVVILEYETPIAGRAQ